MNSKRKMRWRLIRTYWIGWTLAFMFLSLIRGEGTVELGSVQFELWRSLLVSLVFGPFFGTISGYAQILTEERVYGRVSMLRLFVLRTIYALLFLFGLILIAYLMVTLLFEVKVRFMAFVFEPGDDL